MAICIQCLARSANRPHKWYVEISDMGDPCLNDLRRERLDAIVAKHGREIGE